MPYTIVTRAITLQYARHRSMVMYLNHSGRRAVVLHFEAFFFFLFADLVSALTAFFSAASVASN
jgi:hypothetical protein